MGRKENRREGERRRGREGKKEGREENGGALFFLWSPKLSLISLAGVM